jgi:glycosyltransferase involved in cell wall biosynthesis
MNDILISVILPVYNGEEYIEASINSVLNQTHDNFELILIDDGSTDKTRDIISKFRDKRIIYIKNEKNMGLIYSLNLGLKMSKGKYIARMDADDIAFKKRLEIQIKFMESNLECDISGGNYIRLLNGNKFYDKIRNFIVPGRKSKMYQKHEKIKTSAIFINPMIHPTIILRRSSLLNNNLEYDSNYIFAEDYAFWLIAIKKKLVMRNIKHPLIKYRIHQNSISRNEKNFYMKYRTFKKIDELIIDLFELDLIESEVFHKSVKFETDIDFQNYILLINKVYFQTKNLNGIDSKVLKETYKKFIRNVFICNSDKLNSKNYKVFVKDNKELKSIYFFSKIMTIFNL